MVPRICFVRAGFSGWGEQDWSKQSTLKQLNHIAMVADSKPKEEEELDLLLWTISPNFQTFRSSGIELLK
jgi:hypothetical protein